MVLPFVIPHQGLQNLRKRLFYWRTVLHYRLQWQQGVLGKNDVGYKFLRLVFVVFTAKCIEKGLRKEKEDNMHSYALRKANIEAAEKAMWEEELAVHTVDRKVAEQIVLAQRQLEWSVRSDVDAQTKVGREYFHL